MERGEDAGRLGSVFFVRRDVRFVVRLEGGVESWRVAVWGCGYRRRTDYACHVETLVVQDSWV